jgi:hypothetical protein
VHIYIWVLDLTSTGGKFSNLIDNLEREPKENSEISDFQEFFKECFFAGIAKITGQSSAEAIVFHVKFNENSRNLQRVHSSIESMLGKTGAMIVEKSIINEMFVRVKERVPTTLNLSNENFDFVKSAKYIRVLYNERTNRIE